MAACNSTDGCRTRSPPVRWAPRRWLGWPPGASRFPPTPATGRPASCTWAWVRFTARTRPWSSTSCWPAATHAGACWVSPCANPHWPMRWRPRTACTACSSPAPLERRWQVSGAIWRTCLATRERETVVQALAAASTRWVTLTVTEKAYGPELAGLLVEGLAASARGRPCGGLTVASCDNLHHNGRSLQALCVHHARTTDPALAHWIDTVCAFPDSMVDRIVPAGSPAITAQAQEALGVTDRRSAALRGLQRVGHRAPIRRCHRCRTCWPRPACRWSTTSTR
jgi:hypothetical protein